MDIEIKKSFSKDIEIIHDRKLLNSIFKIIKHIKHVGSLKEVKHGKKLEGSKKHYRVKIGDYRLGKCIEDKTVFIVKFLHRNKIY